VWHRRARGAWVTPPTDLPTDWLLARGTLALHLLDAHGEGALLGFASADRLVATGRGSPIALEALEDSEMLALPASALHSIARREPDLAAALLASYDGWRSAYERAVALRSAQARERVAAALHESNRERPERLRVNQEQLARLAGVSRETTNRCLRSMQRDGTITRRDGRYVLATPQPETAG
jgi:CRP-like cAMP-binding protein